MIIENLKRNVEELNPKSINDVIGKNRDKLCLENIDKNDLKLIHKNLPITNLKGTLNGVFVYKRKSIIFGISSIAAVGWIENRLRQTSSIVAFDPKTNVIFTESGSNYLINDFIVGEPDSSHLNFICAMLYHDGLGKYFGVSPFFH